MQLRTTWFLHLIRRHKVLATLLLVLIVILALQQLGFRRLVTINLTESLPHGVYIKTFGSPAVGELVEFHTPASVSVHLDARHEYLLKPIIAGPGDEVDTTAEAVVVNGRTVQHSALQEQDSQGRTLVQWRAKRKLSDDEFFVLSTRVPNSLDSRYFGPIRRNDVESVRKCLWAWEDEQSSAQ
jgi:conjugative transfer signal peptidase TraF